MNRYKPVTIPSTTVIDQNFRAYMLGIYNRMTAALVVTGITAVFASSVLIPIAQGSVFLLLLMALLPLAIIIPLSFGMHKFQLSTLSILFWTFAASMGISLSMLFAIYTAASIIQVFFITAGTFAAASIYGYTTNRDLTSMGSFLIMGMFGILFASIVNLFMASSLMSFVISVIAVIVLTGLTAYDTQKLKDDYLSNGAVYGFDSPAKTSIYGALTLYLDFINIFVHLLQLIGSKK